MSDLVSLISNFGFPALCCFGLAWYVWQKDKVHKVEIEKLSKSIDRLTVTVERALTKLLEQDKK